MCRRHRVQFLLLCAMLFNLVASIQANQPADFWPKDPAISMAANGLPCGVGFPSSSSRIYGGAEAEPGEYPWIVNIHVIGGGHSCGGTIIDDRHILTAAHCLYYTTDINIVHNSFTFYIGDRDQAQQDGEQEVDIEEVMYYTHGHSNKKPDDIALVRTKQPMKFKLTANRIGSVNKICLPPFGKDQFNFKFQHGLKGTVAGWGRTKGDVRSPNKLMKVEESILECRKHLRGDNGTLCTWSPLGTGACYGDSGGPLVVKSVNGTYVLAGLVRGGQRYCGIHPNDDDREYANVYYYMPWILSNIL